MKFISFITSALAITGGVFAQNATNTTSSTTYATGLLSALQAANLTTLLSIATNNSATLLPLLQSGNHTVFAPSNEAFAAVPAATLANSTLVADIVLYHILSGAFPPSSLSANHTIAQSALNATGLVNLPGGQPQVAVLTGANGQATVVQATGNVTSTAATTYENLNIYIIPQVLSLPTTVSATAQAAGLSSLVTALTTDAPTAVPAIDDATGITVFAPSNAAFSAIQSTIATLNMTTIATVLENHVINGTAAYSSTIMNGMNVTSASGQTLSFITNSTGVFVVSGTITAQVIMADVIVQNGVVHVIDQVLANTASNPTAAASAASSASSAAATNSATVTGPVGSPSTTASGSTPSTTTAPASGASHLVAGNILLGLLIAGAAWLF